MTVKNTKIIMGMPITIEVRGAAKAADLNKVFNYFRDVDNRFSPYKTSSELSKVNGGLSRKKWSAEFREVLNLCQQTKQQTDGFFNIDRGGQLDPSGLVKGWAIQKAAQQLLDAGYHNFYIEAGGDIQVHGHYRPNTPWRIGIRNPFNTNEIVKVVWLRDQGMATSGTYIRGQHIYNPHNDFNEVPQLRSLSVIGPDIYEADRYATAAFAMGQMGIGFIETLPGLEGYMIDDQQIATFTSGFENFVATAD